MPRLLKRTLRITGWAILGLVVVLGIAWLLRVPLFGGLVKRQITGRLSEALGGTYAIDAVGGTWFRDLRVEGFRTVEAPPDGPLTSIEARDVAVDYDLLGLLGDRPLGAIDRVAVAGGRVDLDLTRPAAEDAGPDFDFKLLDDVRAHVDVEAALSAETGAGTIDVRGLRVVLAPDHRLKLDVEEVTLPERFDVQGPLAGRVEQVDPRTWRWTSETTVGGVRVPEAVFTSKGRLDGAIEVANGRVDVRLADGALETSTEGLDVGALPAWITGLVDAELPTSGRLAGRARLALGAPISLDFSARTSALVWREYAVQTAEATGSWQGGAEVRVDRLDADADQLMARIRGAVLDARSPYWLREVEKLRVEVRSSQAFVPELERDLALVLQASSRGPRVLEIQELRAADAGGHVLFRGTATLPVDPVAWRETGVEGDLEGVVGDVTPLQADFEGHVAIRGRLDGTLADLDVSLDATGQAARIDGRPVDSARLSSRVRWPEVEVQELTIRAAGAQADAAGRVVLDPVVVPEATLKLAVSDLAGLAPLLPAGVPSLAGSLRADGRLRFEQDVLELTLRAEGSELVVDGVEVGSVTAKVRPDGDKVLVEALEAVGPWGSARGAGDVTYASREARVLELAFESDTLSASLRTPLDVRWTDDVIRLQGLDVGLEDVALGADVTVFPADERLELDRVTIVADGRTVRSAESIDVTWRDGLVRADDLALVVEADTSLRLGVEVDPKLETAVVRRLEALLPAGTLRLNTPLRVAHREGVLAVSDLDATFEGVRVRGAGHVRPADRAAVVDALELHSEDVEARLAAPASLSWGADGVDVADLDVETLGGRVRGRVAFDGEDLRALLVGSGFVLAQFVEGLEGEASFRLRAADGAVAVEATIPELAIGEWKGRVDLQAHQGRETSIQVDRLRVTGPAGGAVNGRAVTSFRVSEQGLETLPDVQPTFQLAGTLAGLDLVSELFGGPAHVEAHGDASGARVRLKVDDVGLCDEGQLCDDALVELHITPDAVAATVSLVNDAFVRIRGHARVDGGFDWSRPAADADAFLDAALSGEFDATVKSWKPIARHAEGLQRLEGGARVRLRLGGQVRDPRFRGDVTLSQFTMEADSDLAPIEKVDAHLVWEDRILSIQRFEGLMGHAPFRIGGSIDVGFDRLPILDLQLHGRNMQLLRTDYLRMRIDTDASITGPVDDLKVEGQGEIVDFTYRKPLTLEGAAGVGGTPQIVLFEIDDEPFDKITFDIRVKADNSIRIRNNFLRMNASFEGWLRGTGKRPEFDGRVSFRNGEIFLPMTTLRRATGDITFRSDAPFRPLVLMTAETRAKGYEMGVQISGSLPDVNLNVFSEPRLDEEDAILMLATGSTGAELAEGGIFGAAFGAVLKAFGGSLFSTRGGDGEPGGKAFFERFEFTTSWDGPRIESISGEVELTEKIYLVIGQDSYEGTNLGVLWRLRLR